MELQKSQCYSASLMDVLDLKQLSRAESHHTPRSILDLKYLTRDTDCYVGIWAHALLDCGAN